MKSSVICIAVCVLMITSIATPFTQNTGQVQSFGYPQNDIQLEPTPSSGGSGGLAVSPWPMSQQNLNHTGRNHYDSDGNNGILKWSSTTNGSIVSTPPIGSDDTIHVGSDDNLIYAIGNQIQDQYPVADIGLDQAVNEGDIVQFDGSGSTGSIGPDSFSNITLQADWQKTTNAAPGQAWGVPRYPIDDPFWLWTDVVWDGENATGGIAPNGHPTVDPFAFWLQYYSVTQYWFKADIYVPEGIIEITMLDPYKPNGIIPINDDFYIWINGNYTGIKKGTRYGVSSHSSCPESDWWYVEALNLTNETWIEGAWNEVWLLIDEYASWGSLGYIEFRGTISTPSEPATIVLYEWDFDANVDSNGDGDPSNDVDASGPTPTHIYGDDGIYIVTLRVTDSNNLSATDICNVTVQNVDPTVTIESITMDVEIGLRVAGRKYNNVNMVLYEDGNLIDCVSIERMPGSPDEQMAWIPVNINFSKSYNATVTYTPEDPPDVGGNPVWIYIKTKDGSINKIHHTFNVQQSKKRDSEHWNHVEPWEVVLNCHFIGLPFEITSHITDPGSDDETLTFTYGSQTKTIVYLNNPPSPDPYPSPEVIQMDILDMTTLVYEGAGTVTMVVKDDDNIRLGVGEGSDSIDIG